MQVGTEFYVYHEKQDAALCAVHSLNALLQGPYFTEIDLMEIAKEFDEKEKQMMMEMGADTQEFLKFMGEESGNLADDGNYSIQVISKALAVWGLTAIPITNPDTKASRENPLLENAFICNLANHWLTIRKVGEEYYNLNSLLDKPQFLSNFYLSAFLDTLMVRGYTVFCIRGTLPRVMPDEVTLSDPNWKKIPKRKNSVSESNDAEAVAQSELEAAIRMSLQDQGTKDTSSNIQSSSHNKESPVVVSDDDGEDEELARAIAMSQEKQAPVVTIEDEPPKGPDTVDIAIRLPDGSRIQRRFRKTNKVETVFDFLSTKGINKEKHNLKSAFPVVHYDNLSQTLEEAGLYPNANLTVQLKGH